MIIGQKIKLIPYILRNAFLFFGRFPRSCNICGYEGWFLAYGYPPRYDAHCPQCNSIERHRLLLLWLGENEKALSGKNILHFAPEIYVTDFLRGRASKYITADIGQHGVDLKLDIENIDLPDGSFDVVVCNHVLEHVDSIRALREINRILVPGGLALLSFPIIEGWDKTYQDDTIVATRQRELHFGQEDHIKYFGRDARRVIVDSGFSISEFTAEEPAVAKHGLQRGEKIFICVRL